MYFGWRETFSKIFKPPGVSQAIQIDKLRNFRVVNDMMNEVGADEARAACYQQIHILTTDGHGWTRMTEISSESRL